MLHLQRTTIILNHKWAYCILFCIFGGFGFTLTFLREVVKDMEDIEGDKAIEAKSLPIVLRRKTNKTDLGHHIFLIDCGINLCVLFCISCAQLCKLLSPWACCLTTTLFHDHAD